MKSQVMHMAGCVTGLEVLSVGLSSPSGNRKGLVKLIGCLFMMSARQHELPPSVILN